MINIEIVPSPCYVIDESLLRQNLNLIKYVADKSGVEIILAFKALEAKGVEIYSCGVCLDFYGVSDKLKVGVVGNAYATLEMLFNSEGTISL